MPLLLAAQRLFTFFICLALAGCQTSGNVFVDYDTETDFSNFRTYDWLVADKRAADDVDPLLVQRVQQALTTQLLNAGFNHAADQQQADIWVRYQISAQIQPQQPQSGGNIRFGGGSGGNMAMGVSLRFLLVVISLSNRLSLSLILLKLRTIDRYGAAANFLNWPNSCQQKLLRRLMPL